MKAYKELERVFTKLYRYEHFMNLAGWDMQAIMPPNAMEARGAAIAELEVLMHGEITNPKVKTFIEEAEGSVGELNELQRANLREIRRSWEKVNRLPEAFVERKALLTSNSQQLWKKCREENDFAGFLPTFKELVELYREEGKLLAGTTGVHPYEALVDVYEPGMTLKQLDIIFENVKSWLPNLLKEVLEKQKSLNASIVQPKGPFPIAKQETLGRACMKLWKFNFDGGRLDVSAHPFCGNVKEDVRITTSYNENDFAKSLFGVIHETGHAKYEQNLGPVEFTTQPVCRARSLGVHESQSLFAEMQIGLSGAFMNALSPMLVEHFGEQPAFTPTNMKRVLQQVQPSLIRIEADELCYPLHVILRCEIERDLIDRKIEAEDVPRAWNEKMKAYFGLETLGNDKEGCLQDIHWFGGAFGYFPTYLLGAMLAAQLMHTVRRELGENVVEDCLMKADLDVIFAKQKEKIWRHGSSLLTEELIKQATGEPLNPQYHREHLERRYRDDAN
ncbi:carboxypeptidase, putative [Trypanosoma equiperdum]|uniref:carboxypeptidase Taq n=3 Tax=Trypanozoon TaxID=39700 RepID=Q386R0_TRYB2|nr:carboxypeptidase, putative [Trypanosoma brucei gambiense DAL972]XP_828333.1 carboxypeptidase, putative [Trypanosoma brucei brucei TREU927]EAN79221.1 carboxypeptidase, putative [Trypanosoma brucei brucei TREU927]CBH17157.1 carboxypeptidase, putative [Trypanosoma brucei gambiense DAL972]SCU73009.1 carboxypeptidase, putative [Trypanosoma equiperdum]|eukprot:XP_011779421.1 carboxypeptidase, putative [Trypanosoma brucei gambiense DAL972]